MKNIFTFLTGLLSLLISTTTICNTPLTDDGDLQNAPIENTLTIVATPALFGLATDWADAYTGLNPAITVKVKPFTDDLSEHNALFLAPADSPEAALAQWKMPVASEAVVLVMNAQNPMLDEINLQGISAEKMAAVFANKDKQSWTLLIDGGQNTPVNFSFTDNTVVKERISTFTKSPISVIETQTAMPVEEFLSSVKKDPYVIGFCKLTDILEKGKNELPAGIKLAPVDKNGNGRMDAFEKIYNDVDVFTRGVWIGKYPKDLCANIFVLANSKPEDQQTLTFLNWILAGGQQQLNSNGFAELTSTVRRANLEALALKPNSSDQPNKPSMPLSTTMILVFVTGLAIIIVFIVRSFRNEKPRVREEILAMVSGFDENSVAAPKGLYFDKTHTWAFLEKDGLIKIGVDDFLQHITGALTRVKMKGAGDKIRRGEKILSIIRNGKQLNIYAPVSGTIKEHNGLLLSDSSLINSSPYDNGWVYLIEPKNWLREVQFLFPAQAYKTWLQDEFARLKDFFAASAKSNHAVYEHIILQDGGEITDNVLADLGPEVWEDFQTSFIDVSR